MSKKENSYIQFVGHNSTDVTGSCNLIKFINYTVLVDVGGVQTNDTKADYVCNSTLHKDIKPRNLTAIILSHQHIDHTLQAPLIYQKGANCPCYISKGSKGLLTLMWQDSVKIFNQEYEKLGRKPIYSQEDVDNALAHIVECDLHDNIKINDNISFELYNAQHITKATQILLKLNNGVNTKTIGFTGDISNKERYYLTDFEPLPRVDILVGECTYSNNKRLHKCKDRNKDMEKLDVEIKSALQSKGKVLIPTFASNRLQEILTTLYTMYNGKSPIKIIVCTPLGKSISDIWDRLIDKNQELWHNVYNWKDVRWVDNYKDMVSYSQIDEPMLVIASGGFLSGGTAVYWTKLLLNNKKNHLVFCGYSSEESIAGQIKSGKIQEIKIDGVKVHNNAHTTTLNSFSSHMDYEQLLDYYTTINYNKICLVHSEQDSKIEFAKELRRRLSKVDKCSKVVSTNYETKINF